MRRRVRFKGSQGAVLDRRLMRFGKITLVILAEYGRDAHTTGTHGRDARATGERAAIWKIAVQRNVMMAVSLVRKIVS